VDTIVVLKSQGGKMGLPGAYERLDALETQYAVD